MSDETNSPATGIDSPFNACMYRDGCRVEHAQRLMLQHHAADMAQRVADLEAERDELRARLAEIEAQEPVRWVANTQHSYCATKLYARPVPAIPDGWRLVPVEPTPEMLTAAARASMQHLIDCIFDPRRAHEVGSEEMCKLTHAERYRSMIAAAPEYKA